MPVAEFEEREYESAACIELALGTHTINPVFPSGQVLEKILGYDAAAQPDPHHLIWRVLGLPRPAGIRLVPLHWFPGARPPASRLPDSAVSLILQFKRPTYLTSARAKQWHRWERPYYRFERTRDQQTVLRRLENRTGPDAVVRYAAPAFWSRRDLEVLQLRQGVLTSSGFVAPRAIGTHRFWTYQRPGTVGYPNPGGQGVRVESVADLLGPENRQSVDIVPTGDIYEHMGRLAGALTDREPALRRSLRLWHRQLLGEVPELETSAARLVTDYAAVQSVLGRVGAIWYLYS